MTINGFNTNSVNKFNFPIINFQPKVETKVEGLNTNSLEDIKPQDNSSFTKLLPSENNPVTGMMKFNIGDKDKNLSGLQKEVLFNSLSERHKLRLLENLDDEKHSKLLKRTENLDSKQSIREIAQNIDVQSFLKFAKELDNTELKQILKKLPDDVINVLYKNTENDSRKDNKEISREDKEEMIISFTDNSSNYSPIPTSVVSDLGLNVINPELNLSAEELKAKLINHPSLKNNPQLKDAVMNLLSKLPQGNKDSLVYLKMILERRPPMEDKKIIECLNKLSQMMDNKNSYVSEIGNKTSFVISCLRDIAAPTNISQGAIGTCNPTSMTIDLAIRNPLKFLEMSDTLAQGKNYDLKDQEGKIIGSIKPNFTFAANGTGVTDNTNRSPSSALMQNSLMDFADGEWRSFNSNDPNKDKNGLWLFQSSILKNMLYADQGKTDFQEYTIDLSTRFDSNYTATNTSIQTNGNLEQETLMSILSESKPSINNPIQVGITYNVDANDPNSRHAVQVIGIDDKTVTIINPHGQEETISREEFEKRLVSVSAESSVAKKIINKPQQIKNEKLETIVNNVNSNDYLKSLSSKELAVLVKKLSESSDPKSKEALNKVLDFINSSIDSYSDTKLSNIISSLKNEGVDLSLLVTNLKNKSSQDINKLSRVINLVLDNHGCSDFKEFNDLLNLCLDTLKPSPKDIQNIISKLSDIELTMWLSANMVRITKDSELASSVLSNLVKRLSEKSSDVPMKLKSLGRNDNSLENSINEVINSITTSPNEKEIINKTLLKLGFKPNSTESQSQSSTDGANTNMRRAFEKLKDKVTENNYQDLKKNPFISSILSRLESLSDIAKISY